MRVARTSRQLDRMVDDIKDEIDRLCGVRSKMKRRAIARDLIEYIQLHHEVQ